MIRNLTFVAVIIALAFSLLVGAQPPRVASAQPPSVQEFPICTAPGAQSLQESVSDGAGGAIILWADERGTDWDIYAQRVDATGAWLWPADGVPICTAVGDQFAPVILGDGSGGAIIAWTDNYSLDLYAQRVDAAGAIQWASDGVPVCTAIGEEFPVGIAPDGSGGAIVAWQDNRDVTEWDIYAQRIDAAGIPLWTANGVPVCDTPWWKYTFAVGSDGLGGAVFAWVDNRSGTDWDIYAQRVDATGALPWPADGVPISTSSGNVESPVILGDGSGGAIIAWVDHRGTDSDIYAQRVDAMGEWLWLADGVPICTAVGDQWVLRILGDGSGGAIIAWVDDRGTDSDIYAQRIDGAGIPLWTANGVVVCGAAGSQSYPDTVGDGAGGTIITWVDFAPGYSETDIYAQRVDATGAPTWTANGVAICTVAGEQRFPQIVSHGSDSAIIAWIDGRSGSDDDLWGAVVLGPANVSPVADAGGPYLGTEGSSIGFDGSASIDPDGTISNWEWDLDGDGTFETTGLSVTHAWDDDYIGSIALRVTDTRGATAVNATTVGVTNVPPAVGDITAPSDPVLVNTVVFASANFTDPGALDTHTATWSWGDGTSSPGPVAGVPGTGLVTGSHTYTSAGVYTISLVVTDDDGATGESEFRDLVVYDPDAGFATGAGWIYSPPGGYVPDETLDGKATFRFVSRYNKGDVTPTGQAGLFFRVAELSFRSASCEWLMISGAVAMCGGSGTINGGGAYRFKLTAIDGALAPDTGVDRFRIEIWDMENNDALVYDSGKGSPEEPILPTGGGNIAIHK